MLGKWCPCRLRSPENQGRDAVMRLAVDSHAGPLVGVGATIKKFRRANPQNNSVSLLDAERARLVDTRASELKPCGRSPSIRVKESVIEVGSRERGTKDFRG